MPRHTRYSIIDQDSNIPLSIQMIDLPTDFIECIKFLLYRKKDRGTFIADPRTNVGFVQDITDYYQVMESKRHPRELAPKLIEVSNKHRN